MIEAKLNEATAKKKQKKFDVFFLGDKISMTQNIPVKIRAVEYPNLMGRISY